MRVTRVEIEQAKAVNLIDFLEYNYPDIIVFDRVRKCYCHSEHDSLVIDNSLWHRFSTNEGGDQISFLETFCGKKFPEAVTELCNYSGCSWLSEKAEPVKKKTAARIEEVRKDYRPPAHFENCDMVKKYLQSRCIPLDTIEMLIERGLLYEDPLHNCVFARQDPGMAILRGTQGIKWIQIIREIPNNYWFFKIGENPENIFIAEAPLDIISVYECNKRRDGIYCAMAGLKKNTYFRILDDFAFNEKNELIKNIKICVDWDDKGEAFVKDILQEPFKIVTVRPPIEQKEITKDWNDVLCLRTQKQ